MKVRTFLEVKLAFCIYPIVVLLFFVFSIRYVRHKLHKGYLRGVYFHKTRLQAVPGRPWS